MTLRRFKIVISGCDQRMNGPGASWYGTKDGAFESASRIVRAQRDAGNAAARVTVFQELGEVYIKTEVVTIETEIMEGDDVQAKDLHTASRAPDEQVGL